MSQREEWADDYGYQSGKCPRCHRTVWSDTTVFECSCGFNNIPEEDQEEEESDENN